MALRIIAGEHRGRLLAAPQGTDTRPTLGRTREALFSILYGKVEGRRVLDLFAGSGALGLEALSRGARECVFCDKSRGAIQAVEHNIQLLKLSGRARVLKGEWVQSLKTLHAERRQFDLVFVDPPYRMDAAEAVRALWDFRIAAEHGIIIVEHGADTQMDGAGGLSVSMRRQYRETALTFLERQEADDEGTVSGQL